jgi:hypothetical protein
MSNLRPRVPTYSENKKPYRVTLTPTARDYFQEYADELGLSFSELLEQIARYPTICNGYSKFRKKFSKSLDIPNL